MNKVMSVLVSVCFLFSSVGQELALGQNVNRDPGVDTLAPALTLGQDMGRIKLILEMCLEQAVNKDGVVNVEALKNSINAFQDSQRQARIEACDQSTFQIFEKETSYPGEYLRIMFRLKGDAHGLRMYHAILPMRKSSEELLPLYLYTDKEYRSFENDLGSAIPLPKGQIEQPLKARALARNVSHQAYDEHVIKWAHENKAASIYELSAAKYQEMIATILRVARIDVASGKEMIFNKRLYLVGRDREIDSRLEQHMLTIVDSHGIEHQVLGYAHTSNDAVHMFVPGEIISGLTAADGKQAMASIEQRLSYEVGAMLKDVRPTGFVTMRGERYQYPVNEVYDRYQQGLREEAIDNKTFDAVDLDTNFETRDYASGAMLPEIERALKGVPAVFKQREESCDEIKVSDDGSYCIKNMKRDTKHCWWNYMTLDWSKRNRQFTVASESKPPIKNSVIHPLIFNRTLTFNYDARSIKWEIDVTNSDDRKYHKEDSGSVTYNGPMKIMESSRGNIYVFISRELFTMLETIGFTECFDDDNIVTIADIENISKYGSVLPLRDSEKNYFTDGKEVDWSKWCRDPEDRDRLLYRPDNMLVAERTSSGKFTLKLAMIPTDMITGQDTASVFAYMKRMARGRAQVWGWNIENDSSIEAGYHSATLEDRALMYKIYRSELYANIHKFVTFGDNETTFHAYDMDNIRHLHDYTFVGKCPLRGVILNENGAAFITSEDLFVDNKKHLKQFCYSVISVAEFRLANILSDKDPSAIREALLWDPPNEYLATGEKISWNDWKYAEEGFDKLVSKKNQKSFLWRNSNGIFETKPQEVTLTYLGSSTDKSRTKPGKSPQDMLALIKHVKGVDEIVSAPKLLQWFKDSWGVLGFEQPAKDASALKTVERDLYDAKNSMLAQGWVEPLLDNNLATADGNPRSQWMRGSKGEYLFKLTTKGRQALNHSEAFEMEAGIFDAVGLDTIIETRDDTSGDILPNIEEAFKGVAAAFRERKECAVKVSDDGDCSIFIPEKDEPYYNHTKIELNKTNGTVTLVRKSAYLFNYCKIWTRTLKFNLNTGEGSWTYETDDRTHGGGSTKAGHIEHAGPIKIMKSPQGGIYIFLSKSLYGWFTELEVTKWFDDDQTVKLADISEISKYDSLLPIAGDEKVSFTNGKEVDWTRWSRDPADRNRLLSREDDNLIAELTPSGDFALTLAARPTDLIKNSDNKSVFEYLKARLGAFGWETGSTVVRKDDRNQQRIYSLKEDGSLSFKYLNQWSNAFGDDAEDFRNIVFGAKSTTVERFHSNCRPLRSDYTYAGSNPLRGVFCSEEGTYFIVSDEFLADNKEKCRWDREGRVATVANLSVTLIPESDTQAIRSLILKNPPIEYLSSGEKVDWSLWEYAKDSYDTLVSKKNQKSFLWRNQNGIFDIKPSSTLDTMPNSTFDTKPNSISHTKPDTSSILRKIMKLIPGDWLSFMNYDAFAQVIREAGCKANIDGEDGKSGFIFSTLATFGEYKDGEYEEGIGPYLPELAKKGIRIAVVTQNDRQDDFIRELNKGISLVGHHIKFGRNVNQVKSEMKAPRYYYLKVKHEDNVAGVAENVTIVVKFIIDAIGKIVGITENMEKERRDMHEAARQFAMAA